MRERFLLSCFCFLLFFAFSAGAGPTQPTTKELAEQGKQQYSEGKYQEAIKFFLDAYNIDRNAGFLYNIGLCYIKLGEAKKAQETFNRILKETHPEDPIHEKAKLKLSELEGEKQVAPVSEQIDSAGGVIEENLENKEKAKQLALQGAKLYQDGKFQEAINLFKESYKLNDEPGFLYNIGICYIKLKNPKAAKEVFQLVVKLTKPEDEYHNKAQNRIKSLDGEIPEIPPEEFITQSPLSGIISLRREEPQNKLYSAAIIVGGTGLGLGSVALGAFFLGANQGFNSDTFARNLLIAKRVAPAADILIAAGATLAVIGYQKARKQTSIVLTTNGAALTVRF